VTFGVVFVFILLYNLHITNFSHAQTPARQHCLVQSVHVDAYVASERHRDS